MSKQPDDSYHTLYYPLSPQPSCLPVTLSLPKYISFSQLPQTSSQTKDLNKSTDILSDLLVCHHPDASDQQSAFFPTNQQTIPFSKSSTPIMTPCSHQGNLGRCNFINTKELPFPFPLSPFPFLLTLFLLSKPQTKMSYLRIQISNYKQERFYN